MVSSETFKLIAIHHIDGVDRKALRRLAQYASLPESEFVAIVCANYPQVTFQRFTQAKEFALSQKEIAQRLGQSVISIADAEYPATLRATTLSPPILYVSGSVEALNSDLVAVVGSRKPTKHGCTIAKRVVRQFTQSKWGVVSGLAEGIDKVAHQTCIEEGGKTVAVMANGLDQPIYPAVNVNLAQSIVMSGGALISEYPYGTPLKRSYLVARNTIQAALSNGVILVQSTLSGGSLYAPRAAISCERPLIVVGQSSYDTKQNGAQIAANLILLDGSIVQVRKLLKTKDVPKSLLIKMRTKNDYHVAIQALSHAALNLGSCEVRQPLFQTDLLI